VHLFGASFYFGNARNQDAAQDAAHRAGADGIPHVTPGSSTISLELVMLIVSALALVWFVSRAKANLRALGVEPRLSALIDWWWAPWLLAVWPQVMARDLLGQATTWSDLRLANALECGGEATTGVAALLTIVAVTRLSRRESRLLGARARPAFLATPERVAPQAG
jgi:hypothetical protein